MKILYVTPAFHHPTMRGPTRCYYFTRELGRRHAITLLSLTREAVKPDAIDEMAGYTDRIVTVQVEASAARLGGMPVVGPKLRDALGLRSAVARMKRAFHDLVRRQAYDVVLFHGKILTPLLEGFSGPPIVIDFCDATSFRVRTRMRHAHPARLPLLGLRYLQVRQVEARLLGKSPHLAFVSCRDRDAVLGPRSTAAVVPIGVDHGFWTRRQPPTHAPTLVLTGVMSYRPNADAAQVLIDRILPRVRQAIPEAQLLLVGRDPSPGLVARGREVPGVTVTGFVDDVRPYLERSALMAAPMRLGSGVQNKALEAMAMELPVVTTSLVADGLRIEGNQSAPVVVADRDEEAAARIIALLGQPGERQRLGAAGRRFVESHYDWSRSAARLERICESARQEAAA